MTLTDKSHLIKLLKDNNIWTQKHLGQNFLVNQKVLEKIVETAELKPTDEIVEVGPAKIGIQIDAVSGKLAGKLASMIANKIEGTGIVISDGNIVINSRNLNANDLLKRLHKAAGGRGGGSAQAASGRLDRTITNEQIIKILQEE